MIEIILLMLGYSTKLSGTPIGHQSALDFHNRTNKALSFTHNMSSQQKYQSHKLPQLGRSMSLSKSAKLKMTTYEATLMSMS